MDTIPSVGEGCELQPIVKAKRTPLPSMDRAPGYSFRVSYTRHLLPVLLLIQKAFIFSLENVHLKPPTQIFPKESEVPKSCCTHTMYGPLWGTGFDLGILGHPNEAKPTGWCRIGVTYPAPYPGDNINPHDFINGSPRDFLLAELEVFAAKRLKD